MIPFAAYIDLILNLSLLVALTVVSGFVDKRWARTTREGLLLQGLLFGTAAMLGMLRPFTLQPGLFYDGRSVLISLGAFFFGPWVAVISGAMAGICRISMGGTGAYVGMTVIMASALIGLAARHRLRPDLRTPTVPQLFLLGIAVHVAMVLLMLQRKDGLLLVGQIGPPVMLLYPLATILAGKILSDQVDAERALRALRDSEERFRSVVESAPDAIFVQTDFRFAYANRACQEMLGAATADDLIGREVLDITHPEFREAIAERMRLLNEERAPVARIQYRVVRLDGSAVPVEVGAVPFTYGGRNGALVFMHDITQRREAEARMAEQLDELRRWHEATVGREMRVLELKREVNRAMALAGQPPPYPSAEDGG